MAKAVLVMDMPESCSKCKFLYEFQGVKKCQLMNVLNNGASRMSQNTFTVKRHGKCPLCELPEKMEVCGKCPQPGKPASSYRFGWNACLKAILGDK